MTLWAVSRRERANGLERNIRVKEGSAGECDGKGHLLLEWRELSILNEFDSGKNTVQRTTKLMADRRYEGRFGNVRSHCFEPIQLCAEAVGERRKVSDILVGIEESVRSCPDKDARTISLPRCLSVVSIAIDRQMHDILTHIPDRKKRNRSGVTNELLEHPSVTTMSSVDLLFGLISSASGIA